ncbi:MAG TPA: hypothetical protein VJT83_02045 [Chitinophagaceae bacterium]|nr:hypothetical protein [Chitinophagaceae bacterium]
MRRKVFVYHEDDQKHSIVLQLPKKIADEITLMDGIGNKEQQFYYSDSSLIYVTFFTKSFLNSATKTIKDGKDPDGRAWKQIQFENFEIGYRFVNPLYMSKYDDAVSAIRIR